MSRLFTSFHQIYFCDERFKYQKPLTEPYVRLSRIRLFIIIFTVSKQADINLWHCQWIIFQHFNESFSYIQGNPSSFFSGENLHIFSLTQPVFPNLLATLYLAFNAPSFIVKKRMDIPFLIPPMKYLDSGITPAFLRSIIRLAYIS